MSSWLIGRAVSKVTAVRVFLCTGEECEGGEEVRSIVVLGFDTFFEGVSGRLDAMVSILA